MKWIMGVVVALAMCSVGFAQTDFWITADAGGTHADITVQAGGSFELYAFVDPAGIDPEALDTLRMWAGLDLPGIAQFTAVEMLAGVAQPIAVFPEEVLYGAEGMGLLDPSPFAKLTLEALEKGSTNTISFPVQSIPGGIRIVGDAGINVVPEPSTFMIAAVLAIGLAAFRRRR